MQDQDTARTLSNGEPCGYARYEGRPEWHEHDHGVCQDSAEPTAAPERGIAFYMAQPGMRAVDDGHVAEDEPAVPLEEALRPAEDKRQARKAAREAADGFRALAAMVEANPELMKCATFDGLYAFHTRSAEDQAAFARAALKHGAKVEKDVWEKQHNLLLRWGPVAAFVLARREDVCERVVTGIKTVTDVVKDPQAVAALPDVEVTREVPEFEWVCKPVLAATTTAPSTKDGAR